MSNFKRINLNAPQTKPPAPLGPPSSIEASTLGWKPGHFPRTFEDFGFTWTEVTRHSRGDSAWNQELLSVEYQNRVGDKLTVFND